MNSGTVCKTIVDEQYNSKLYLFMFYALGFCVLIKAKHPHFKLECDSLVSLVLFQVFFRLAVMGTRL